MYFNFLLKIHFCANLFEKFVAKLLSSGISKAFNAKFIDIIYNGCFRRHLVTTRFGERQTRLTDSRQYS